MLGKRHYVKNIIAAGGFGLQWSARRPESRCVSVGTLYVHVSLLTCSRLFPRRREGCREWEWGEREGGGRRKRKLCSPALWLCCKGGPAQSGGTTHSWTPRGPRGRKSAGLRHTPTSDVAQHTTDSESDSNWCSTLLIVSSSPPHHPPRCLLIYTLIDVSRLSRPHSITHPPPPPTSSFSLLVFRPLLPPLPPLSSFPSTRNVSALFTLQSSDFLTR